MIGISLSQRAFPYNLNNQKKLLHNNAIWLPTKLATSFSAAWELKSISTLIRKMGIYEIILYCTFEELSNISNNCFLTEISVLHLMFVLLFH